MLFFSTWRLEVSMENSKKQQKMQLKKKNDCMKLIVTFIDLFIINVEKWANIL